jgi:hypothetical protein
MKGKRRYQNKAREFAQRKESKSIIFSGALGITTGGKNVVDVPGRPGFVWVRLRNQLNETIWAFNESVATVFDLPVQVEWDGNNKNSYKIIGRDVGLYTVWGGTTAGSVSSYLPAHGSSHSYDTVTGVGGGDVVWVYGSQFMPALITPSGSAGADSLMLQPYVYFHSGSFHYAGGTGIAVGTQYNPTGTANARMLLVYLDQDTGNPGIATGSLTEFAATNTGTASVVPFIPAPINDDDLALAGLRVVTGTSDLQWTNIYDVRQFLV